jgi:membrane protein DedA with SNARE-associated domain
MVHSALVVASVLSFLESLFSHYGYAIIAVLVGMESAGIPLPGETSLLAGAVVAQRGGLDIFAVVGVAAGAAIVGDNLGYLFGRKVGRGVVEKHGHWVHIRRRQIQLLDYSFREHGSKLVFFGRWVALLRFGAALFAGAAHMSWPRFAFWNALGCILWASVMGAIGYLFATSVSSINSGLGIVGIALSVLFVGAVIYFGHRWTRRFEREAQERQGGETEGQGSRSLRTGTDEMGSGAAGKSAEATAAADAPADGARSGSPERPAPGARAAVRPRDEDDRRAA